MNGIYCHHRLTCHARRSRSPEPAVGHRHHHFRYHRYRGADDASGHLTASRPRSHLIANRRRSSVRPDRAAVHWERASCRRSLACARGPSHWPLLMDVPRSVARASQHRCGHQRQLAQLRRTTPQQPRQKARRRSPRLACFDHHAIRGAVSRRLPTRQKRFELSCPRCRLARRCFCHHRLNCRCLRGTCAEFAQRNCLTPPRWNCRFRIDPCWRGSLLGRTTSRRFSATPAVRESRQARVALDLRGRRTTIPFMRSDFRRAR